LKDCFSNLEEKEKEKAIKLANISFSGCSFFIKAG
jgi:hypothetical protein